MAVNSINNKRYPQISFKYKGKKLYVRMHRLAAYCFYGDAMYDAGIVVRHLNDIKTDLRRVNIKLGTQKQNIEDMSPLSIKEANKKRRKFNLENGVKPPRTYKISDSEIPSIIEMLDEGLTQREVARLYMVHHSTIGYINSNRRYTYEENRNP